MKKISLLAALFAVSISARAEEPSPFLESPTVRAQSSEGAACLMGLLAERLPPYSELFDFEGPYFPRYAVDESTLEYWVWTNRIRAPGFIIKIRSAFNDGWRDTNAGFTSRAMHATAQVYEFLRGGDTGLYMFSVDLGRCAPFFK